MKAPEKIYITNYDIEALPKEEQLSERWHEVSTQDTDIKYIRTDAFVEKALKWYCLDCACNDNCKYKCAFWGFFKDYLEGNDKALPPKIENAFNPDGSTTENYRYRQFIERMQDAFIEKACTWLKENKDKYLYNTGEKGEYIPTCSGKIIDEFRKYMKGETL